MAARLSEPPCYPPPPPLLPRGMRPANPTLYTQRQPLPAEQLASQAVSQAMVMNGCERPRQTPACTVASPPEVPKQRVHLSESELEKRLDKASIKGNFGWMTLDGVNIPCLFRNEEKYVSVRMVEQKLLSKYPSTYPDELRDRPPLKSQFITSAEAKLLNEINIEHCECEFGQQAFTEKDLIVSWPDFVDFYRIVKKHFPNENVAAKQRKSYAVVSAGGGWVQVNNTVVPYLKRLTPNAKETLRLAPLPVIKYAAGLLTDTEVPCLEPTDEECHQLSEMCRKAGLDFKFSRGNTQLVLLSMIPAYSGAKVVMKKLPDDDPFASAEYCPEIEDDKINVNGQCGVILPTMQDIPSPPYGMRPASNGHQFLSKVDNRPPPNVTVQRSSTVVSSVPSGMYSVTGMERSPLISVNHGPMMVQHGSSSPALQALEQLSGPPMKRQKITATSVSMGPVPRTSPSQMNGAHVTSMPQQGFLPGMPPYASVQFSAGNPRMIAPHGMVPGAFPGWPPAPQHPGDMQKLAEMMNIQAAILSQARPMAPTHPMMDPSKNMMSHLAPRKTNTQVAQMSQNKALKQNLPVSNDQSTVRPKKKSLSLLDKIQPIDFHGKKISCLVKEDSNQQLALIEAISRVYFPQCSLDEFINAIANVMQLSIYQLSREEEKAFIKFYGLPTESLKCSKVLNLQELDPIMPQIKYMFRDRERPVLDGGQGLDDGRAARSGLAKPSVDDQDTSGGAVSGTSSMVTPPSNPFKKSSSWSKKALGKVASKLEDAVNRLRQNKMLELGGSSPTAAAAAGGGGGAGGGVGEPAQTTTATVPPQNPFETQDATPVISLPDVSQAQ